MKKHRVLIYGAGSEGFTAYRALKSGVDSSFEVTGFVDDNPANFGKRLNGCRVLGNGHHLPSLAKLYKPAEVILALDTVQPDRVSKAVEACQKAGLSYRMFSPLGGNGGGAPSALNFRGISLSDLLSFPQSHIDPEAARSLFEGKTILVNGSGGALGLELCRHALQSKCRKLVILDKYESYLTHLVAELYGAFSSESIAPVLLNNGKAQVKSVFEEYRPDMVIHAAARKFAPLFQLSTGFQVLPDPGPTLALAALSREYGTKVFLMISSLLAGERGDNGLAKSLRDLENLLRGFFKGSECRLVITRICDIIENRGGIVSIIEEQVRNQEAVTLPRADARVCLMSKDSASRFILGSVVKAGQDGSQGDVFTCDFNGPVPLIQIARKIADFHGLKLGRDVAVKYMDNPENPSKGAEHLTEQKSFLSDLPPEQLSETVVQRAEDQISRDLGGEGVILSLRKNRYYGLDAVGTRIWGLISEPRKIGEILEILLEEYDVEPGRCETDLRELLQSLSDEGLIEIANART